MPMYPYYVSTIYGNSYPYDTETNVSAWQPTGTILLVHNPLPETRVAKRFYVVQPVHGSGIRLADGTTMPVEALQHLYGRQIDVASNGAPVIMGYPIDEKDITNKQIMTTMKLPGQLIPVWVIVLVCIAIIMAAAAIISIFVPEQIKQFHALDLAAQSQDMVERLYINTDTGEQHSQWFEGATIERRTLKNGEILDIPMNQAGQDWNMAQCGKAICVINEGVDMEALAGTILTQDWLDLIKWIVIAAVAIGGIYIAAKVIPGLFRKKLEYPQYYPPPERRVPGIPQVE